MRQACCYLTMRSAGRNSFTALDDSIKGCVTNMVWNNRKKQVEKSNPNSIATPEVFLIAFFPKTIELFTVPTVLLIISVEMEQKVRALKPSAIFLYAGRLTSNTDKHSVLLTMPWPLTPHRKSLQLSMVSAIWPQSSNTEAWMTR